MKNLILFTLGLFISLPAEAKDVMVVTENLRPYNYLEDGEAQGMSSEVVKAVFEEIGYTAKIQFMPWARAYQTALTKPNTLVYSIARTPQREELFAWIGEIAPHGAALYQRADKPDLNLKTLADAKSLYVGVYRGDAKESTLRGYGFENLQTTDDDRLNLRKLMLGRLDLIAIDGTVLRTMLAEEGIDPRKIRQVIPIEELSGQLYMAFSAESDPKLVDTFKTGLVTIKENGTFEKILKQYLLIN